MLFELMIENFALIRKLNVNFCQGLNILTGETGAGKSIIIDAVNLVIGDRADKSLIRTGEDKAVVQAVFYSKSSVLELLLAENGVNPSEDGSIIITREIYSNGRSASRLNDKLVTVTLVREVCKYLIDIHGQHAHQSLLYPDNHMHTLDMLMGEKIEGLKKEVEDSYHTLKNIERKLKELNENDLEKERRKDILNFQVNEIDNAELIIDEEDHLIERQALMANSEKIYKIMAESYEIINNGSNEYSSILDGIGSIISDLEDIKHFDKEISNIFEVLQEAFYKIEDCARDIRNYRDHVEFDSAELDQIEKRLDIVNKLKRKYGKTILAILEYRKKIGEELAKIESSQELIEQLTSEKYKVIADCLELSKQLSKARQSAANYLTEKMNLELLSLNMNKANFKVHIENNVDHKGQAILSAKGIDKVEFLISTNAGEPLKSLVKIASGGELSRIMLAIKTILAKSDQIPTIIFDEIDAGISGRTANIVGEKLAAISKTHQILCITHLPQIASMADQHYFIEKNIVDELTLTSIQQLSDKERISELARLLGGVSLTDLTLKHAAEVLKLAEITKQSL